jgi:hypothetical protein
MVAARRAGRYVAANATTSKRADVAAIYTYGHPVVDGGMMDRLPGVKVIRLGVDISSSPDGRSTRRHSATNCG